MKKLCERYWKFLKGFVRKDTDYVFLSISLALILFACMLSGELFRFGAVGILAGICFSIIIFAVAFGFTMPLYYAAMAVYRENEFNQIVVDCLNKIGELRTGLETDQVYRLSKGYSILRNDVARVSELLEKALGPEFEVRIQCHYDMPQYQIELIKRLELQSIGLGS